MTKSVSFVLALIVLSLTGLVNAQTSASKPDTNVIVPLGVGYRWEGILTTYQKSDSVLSSQAITFVSKLTDHNEDWYRFAYINDGDTVLSIGLLTNRKEDVWQKWYTYNAPDTLNNDVDLFLKYPALAGDEYVDRLGTTTSVVWTDTLITVPAGTFRCTGYAFSDPTDANGTYTLVFASPRVGWVKKEAFDRFNEVEWRWVLTKLVK